MEEKVWQWEIENEYEVSFAHKILLSASSDPLGSLHLVKVPQHSKIRKPVGDQVFKNMSLLILF